MSQSGGMQTLLRDTRVQRLLVANTLGSIGSGITIFSVPWLLVHRPEGNAAYRWATIATTIAGDGRPIRTRRARPSSCPSIPVLSLARVRAQSAIPASKGASSPP